jgi:hypothetical protein
VFSGLNEHGEHRYGVLIVGINTRGDLRSTTAHRLQIEILSQVPLPTADQSLQSWHIEQD